MALRPYQVTFKKEIKAHFARGNKRVLGWLATGAGKTVSFCDMIQEVDARGKHAIVVVRGRKLVEQASKRLFRENVRHGVMMANHWNYKPYERVQVCSIDTLLARQIKPKADLMIIDEAHLFGPDSKASDLLNEYDCFVLAVTATPYHPKGLAHLADVIVHPITMMELIQQGSLVDFKYFAPSSPDMKGVKTTNGEYNNIETENRMIAGQLTGKIIDHWTKYALNRPTICFAVNINHSKFLVQKFLDAGIAAEHLDADTPDSERENIIRRIENGQTKIVSNVGVLCIGVDIPCVSAIIGARPTQSINLFIQQAGRGTRLHDLKKDCLYFDHAGNIERHSMFPTEEPQVDLEGNITETYKMLSKTCKTCFAVYRGTNCPECGPREKVDLPFIEIAESEDELHELVITATNPVEQWLQKLEQDRKKLGRQPGWQYKKLLEKFTEKECMGLIPKWWLDIQAKKEEENLFKQSPFSGGKPSWLKK